MDDKLPAKTVNNVPYKGLYIYGISSLSYRFPQFRAQLFLYGIILGIDNCPYYRGFFKSKEIVVPLHFKFRAQTII